MGVKILLSEMVRMMSRKWYALFVDRVGEVQGWIEVAGVIDKSLKISEKKKGCSNDTSFDEAR